LIRFTEAWSEESTGGNLMPVGPTNRRAFIVGIGSAAAWPPAARAVKTGLAAIEFPQR
jgi:hypothetical protein